MNFPDNKWGIPAYYNKAIKRETYKWLRSRFELTDGQCRDISENMVRICSRYFTEAKSSEAWFNGTCCKPFKRDCIHNPAFNIPKVTETL